MSCPASSSENTITITNCYIQTTLDKVILDIEACGTFTTLYVYTGSGFLTNIGTDLTTNILTNMVVAGDSVSVHLELNPIDIGLSAGADIDTILIFRVESTRTAIGGSTVNENKLFGTASYASVYPCLINKIENIDAGCSDCESLNNALLLDMLMQSTSMYLMYDRFSDAVNTYNKMADTCREYNLIYKTNPTYCDLYGGIGCWIIGSTFQVSSSSSSFVPEPITL